MLTAKEISKAIAGKKTTAAEVLESRLKLIKERDGEIGAFLEVFGETARAGAAAVDRKIAAGGRPGRLAGVPVAIKDNLLYSGHRMTCASRILEGYVAPYTATAVQRLLDEDAVIVGRTNMDEFAMGSSTENSAFKRTRNPANPDCVPGGSSGGSAAAVAAGFCPIALGSDTGGSIRQPAAFCGVYGLRPTYGTVSRHGLTAFASSLDQVGPLASTAEDLQLAFEALAGHDPKDSTSVAPPAAGSRAGAAGLRIGLPKEFFSGDNADEETLSLTKAAAAALERLGARLVEVTLPHVRYAVPAYHVVAASEASSNLGRFDGLRYGFSAPGADLAEVYKKTRGLGFGPEVKRRILLGTCALSAGCHDAYYLKAQKVRTLIKRDFEAAFEKADFIIGPTAPTPAFRFGEKGPDPLAMYLSDFFTVPCSLAGLCGVSAPAGRNAAGLPVGVQLLGRPFSEPVLFELLKALQNG
ncbi:MAG: glutaminyl-tRNA synthase (glutamine-hydrolyzing) subunit A [Elusimicrobia bacterium GWA2_61_42]|nr:MAG: glutaminyl-tRNA synthase (glutamine-hydrolyzing) subunit A [Elusimicrobia bacterium GWA2_61_42]OGR76599.1 MAG: glutaminyl-tRNA synthase (glutamine-hydrolyzing) subunit A [Elusimicrobia bacterium GWC2_61_25]